MAASTKNPRVAYVIPQRVEEHNLHVLHSANAWWMDQAKLHKLLAGFAIDMTILEACAYTGISERQYKYFDQLHPVIREIRIDLKAMISMRARSTMMKAIENGDGKLAFRYLERTEPEEWARPSIKARRAATQERVNMQKKVAEDQEEYSKLTLDERLQKLRKTK